MSHKKPNHYRWQSKDKKVAVYQSRAGQWYFCPDCGRKSFGLPMRHWGRCPRLSASEEAHRTGGAVCKDDEDR